MKTETRSFELRVSDDKDSFLLAGLAVSYDTLSQEIGGGFYERIMPGTFSRSIAQGADVKCLLNHDSNVVLGRTKSGTLTLHDETDGLKFHVQLDRNSVAHQNVYSMVKRGDLSECSFSFVVPSGGDDFDQFMYKGKQITRRTVRNADLRDVSVVTYPAYQDGTFVNARTEHVGTQLLSAGAIDAANRRKADELGRMISAERAADIAKEIMAAKPTNPEELDEYNRRRAEELRRVIADDFKKGHIG